AREKAVQALLDICDKNNLGAAFRARVENYRAGPWDKIAPQVSLRILFKKAFFDLEKSGVKNVYEASLFAKKILDRRQQGEFFFKERFGFIAYQVARKAITFLHRRDKKWGY